MSLQYVYRGIIKGDKGEILRLYFKHICVLLLLSVFPENYFFAVRVNNFGPYPYPIVDPLD